MTDPTFPEFDQATDNPWGKPESCRVCTLFLEPGPVLGAGNRNAKILYLGGAPGAAEVDWPGYYVPEKHGPVRPNICGGFRPKRFKPFIGGNGRIRDSLFFHSGIDKTVHTYSTNCVKCRTPGDRAATEYETACCGKFLVEEIEDVNPNVIITAGETALNVTTGKVGIGVWRGVPTAGPTFSFKKTGADGVESTESRTYKVFPTWMPLFLMHAQWNWAFAVHDLVRAKAQSAFPEIIRTPINIIRDASVARDREALRADIRARGAFTFDFETTGLSARSGSILMCGFVGRPDTAHVFDWTTGTQQFFQELLDDDSIEIIGQNILNFDLPFAEDKGSRIRWTRVFDTMVAFHLANSSYGQTAVGEQNAGTFRVQGAEKDLAFIASNHTDIEYWKSRENYKGDLKGVCGVDCIATDRSAMHPVDGLKEELRRYDMTSLYYDHVLPVHPVLRRMTKRGVNVDMLKAMRTKMILSQEADHLEKVLRDGLNAPDLNLNSSPQLMKIVYGPTSEGGLGLPPVMKHDKRKRTSRPTLDAAAIDQLATEYPENVILQAIVEIRHKRKMESTFIDPMMEEGRIHARFGVSKASNGRFNSWNPNAQNVPEDMRDIWIPDSDEHVLISADSSQIEWRNAMVISGDEVGLELLASGVDNHRAVAAETLGKRIENVDDGERHASKFIVYGLGYGRGASSISKGHRLEMGFVERFIASFFRRFHTFYEWRESLPGIVRAQHYLANPWKRRRWWWTQEITEIYNFPASSTAADMMIEELLALDRELPKDATLRLTVHDEVVINCPKDIVRETVLCVRTHMQRCWPEVVEFSARPEVVKRFYPNGWYVPADIHIGTNWKQCKSKDPEDRTARLALAKELGLEES